MLDESHGMFKDAVRALHDEGSYASDIYQRDQQLNKYERSVRRKIVTHMSVSTKPDINMGLVLTAIVIDIERIGDYAKNLFDLSVVQQKCKDEFHADLLDHKNQVSNFMQQAITLYGAQDEKSAKQFL